MITSTGLSALVRQVLVLEAPGLIRSYPELDAVREDLAPQLEELFDKAGYKLVADGSNQGFTGLQREPYLGTEDDRGLAYMSAEELTDAALERAGKGWHLAIHGNGDAAIDNILDTCEALVEAGIDMSKVRPRIEHCSILHDEQIARMKKLGVIEDHANRAKLVKLLRQAAKASMAMHVNATRFMARNRSL